MAAISRKTRSKLSVYLSICIGIKLPGNAGDHTCKTFVFEDEGHTLGNALRCIIARYREVQFCGYTVPHPSENKMHFRIQTSDGSSAVESLRRGLEDLENVCDHTIKLFEKEVRDFGIK